MIIIHFMLEGEMILHYRELSNNVRLVRLEGELDALAAAEIEHELAVCCAVHGARVVIDLTEVEYLTSVGMRILIRNAKELVHYGGHMYLVGPTPHVKDKLEMTGISWIIPIYDSVTSAESSFGSLLWL